MLNDYLLYTGYQNLCLATTILLNQKKGLTPVQARFPYEVLPS